MRLLATAACCMALGACMSSTERPDALDPSAAELIEANIVVPQAGFSVEAGNELEAALAAFAASPSSDTERAFMTKFLRSQVYLKTDPEREPEPNKVTAWFGLLTNGQKSLAVFTAEQRLGDAFPSEGRQPWAKVSGRTALELAGSDWVAINYGLPSGTYLSPEYVEMTLAKYEAD